ncbi:hypothetical protein H5410_016642 [Solanum commersonii]|uniref:Uncharacterized protein n=1 Tax=Solanum commersonii TaxID=4109 RepID=A0A9J5ZXW5_SOLCO|nr:hypothetical protein H5410_016642 [Solanum commersonii]
MDNQGWNLFWRMLNDREIDDLTDFYNTERPSTFNLMKTTYTVKANNGKFTKITYKHLDRPPQSYYHGEDNYVPDVFCEREIETTNHLFIHCRVTVETVAVFVNLRGIGWSMPRHTSSSNIFGIEKEICPTTKRDGRLSLFASGGLFMEGEEPKMF